MKYKQKLHLEIHSRGAPPKNRQHPKISNPSAIFWPTPKNKQPPKIAIFHYKIKENQEKKQFQKKTTHRPGNPTVQRLLIIWLGLQS